jgi:hypothetical protein
VALIVMPLLAWGKRRTAHATNNSHALAADAVQSATCAYLAVLTLAGLAINAAFHIHWIDRRLHLPRCRFCLWKAAAPSVTRHVVELKLRQAQSNQGFFTVGFLWVDCFKKVGKNGQYPHASVAEEVSFKPPRMNNLEQPEQL